jgi:hypothetical protein
MIYQLAKRDMAWAQIPWLVVIMTGAVAALGAMNETTVMPLGIMLIVAATIPAQARERETNYLLSLPITRQEIFVARVVAVLMLVWFPALASAAICRALGRPGAGPLMDMAAVATVVAVLFQATAIREIRIPAWLPMIVSTVLFTVCFTGLVLSREKLQIPVAPVVAGAGILSSAIFWNTWNAIPLFQPGRARRRSTPVRATSIQRPGFPWWLFSWINLVWLAILPLISLTNAPNGLLFLWSAPNAAIQKTRWLDSLPVGRRTILAASILPLLTVLLLGSIAGTYFGIAGQDRNVMLVSSQLWPPPAHVTPCARPSVVPLLDRWVRVPPGTAAPVLTAPWGESFQPPVVTIYGVTAYNPFAVGCHNSSEFLDWQYKRAGSHRRLEATPRTRILTATGLATLALITFLPMFLSDWWRVRRLPAKLRASILTVSFVLLFAVAIVPPFYDSGPALLFRFNNVLQWVSWTLPDDTRLATAIMIAIPIALYFIIERLFLASELLPVSGQIQPTGNYN